MESIACSGAASPQWMPRPFQFHSPSRLLLPSGGGESGRVLATLAAGSVGASPSSNCVDV